MSGHRNFNELLSKMSPERRARVKAEADDLHREYVLSQFIGPMPGYDEETRAGKPASRLKGIVPIPREPVSLSDMEDAIQDVKWRHGIT